MPITALRFLLPCVAQNSCAVMSARTTVVYLFMSVLHRTHYLRRCLFESRMLDKQLVFHEFVIISIKSFASAFQYSVMINPQLFYPVLY